MKKVISLISFAFIFSSCILGIIDTHKYDEGRLPETPQNISFLNTEFDDYNSALPSTLGASFPMCFSTNRNSSGHDFDIIYKQLAIEFDRHNGNLSIFKEDRTNLNVYIDNMYISNAPRVVNTPEDEFGPYLIKTNRKTTQDGEYNYYTPYYLLYSSGIGGNQDIYVANNLLTTGFADPIKIDFLNSDFDDAYPSLNSISKSIVFASNREGKLNIYSIANKNPVIFNDIFYGENDNNVEKLEVLCSDYDDTCPQVYGKYIVFASNRPGGYGGYDLYYSEYEDGHWSEVINFGDKINSEYDEFRPVIRSMMLFENDFMLFSSNRPGGKGAFDLYYVGIPKLDEYYFYGPSVDSYMQ